MYKILKRTKEVLIITGALAAMMFATSSVNAGEGYRCFSIGIIAGDATVDTRGEENEKGTHAVGYPGGATNDVNITSVSKDIDIIALVPLSEVRPILEKLNIRFSEHTNAHSRIKFEVGGISVDVISVKSDYLPENLRSRDFTINSVAQSVTGQFYDPTRGLDDLKKKLLRTPGNDPITTFEMILFVFLEEYDSYLIWD